MNVHPLSTAPIKEFKRSSAEDGNPRTYHCTAGIDIGKEKVDGIQGGRIIAYPIIIEPLFKQKIINGIYAYHA